MSKVIMGRNVWYQWKSALCEVTLWRNGVYLKGFNGTDFSWKVNVGFNSFNRKVSAVFYDAHCCNVCSQY